MRSMSNKKETRAMDVKVALLTCTWRRPALTNIVMDYYSRLSFSHRRAVTSRLGESYKGWTLSYHENQPLSDKWQHGLKSLKQDDFDALMIVGSDDLITPAYLDACKYLIGAGADYVYLPGCYFYDTSTDRMIWAQAPRLGMGRCISRSLIERLDWQLWEPGLERGLDGSMATRIEATGTHKVIKIQDPLRYGYVGLDVKTSENIWSFDDVFGSLISYEVPAVDVFNEYFPSVKDEIISLGNGALRQDAQTDRRAANT